MEPENTSANLNLSGQDEPDRETTKARQLLTIYYLLKAGFNIEHRDEEIQRALKELPSELQKKYKNKTG